MKININMFNCFSYPIVIVLFALFLNSCEKEKTDTANEEIKNESNSESQLHQTQINEQLGFNEVNNFINEWCSYQSNSNIQEYLNCYSPDFIGVKRTNSGKEYIYSFSDWAADRSKMYQTAENLNISAIDLNIKSYSEKEGLTIIEFEQYYISKKYSDRGTKIMKLKKNNKNTIKIYYEELVNSQKLGE